MRRLAPVITVALGVLLVLVSAGVRWIAAPHLAVLPSDTDTTRVYTGTASTLFNAKALTSPAAGPVLLQKVPISVTHRTKVLQTKGGNALVADSGSVTAAGSSVGGFDYRYAVDRTDMGRGSGFRGTTAQTGVTFNWPIRTQKHDYPGWVPDTQTTVPLRYAGTTTHGGLSTYVFTTTSQPSPITDPQTLAALPTGLPKATLAQLAAGLGLAPTQLGALQQVLPTLPDPVPFNYTYQVKATYWVEPSTGTIVDLQEQEVRTLALKVGSNLVPVTPVMDISYTSSPAQLASAVSDARHDANLVKLVYTRLPLILLIAGLVLTLLGGLGLAARRRHRSEPPQGTDSSVEQSRVMQTS